MVLNDPDTQDEIAYGAALDSVFEALYEGFEDKVGGRNFDPNAFTTSWGCWDHCPWATPWECGTYGIFDVEWSYWGECPAE